MTKKSTCAHAETDKPKTEVANQLCIREAVKLAVALQLKCDGYETVSFNRVVEGERFVVDVYAEDSLGSPVAVCCVFSADEACEERLNDLAFTVVEALGDNEGRVRCHDPNVPYRSTGLALLPPEKPGEEAVLQPEEHASSKTTARRDF